MFTIRETKTWAKKWGYTIIKEKDNSVNVNGASYYWAKDNDPSVTGVALSVSKVARAIFNDLTNNKWVDHQQKFEEDKSLPEFTVSDYD